MRTPASFEQASTVADRASSQFEGDIPYGWNYMLVLVREDVAVGRYEPEPGTTFASISSNMSPMNMRRVFYHLLTSGYS